MSYVVYLRGRECEIGRTQFLAEAAQLAQEAVERYGREAYVIGEAPGRSIYDPPLYRVGRKVRP